MAPTLNPGVYVVMASAPTFRTTERTGVRLEVAANIGVDFQLDPGSISETVQVEGEQAPIDTLTDTLGGPFASADCRGNVFHRISTGSGSAGARDQ